MDLLNSGQKLTISFKKQDKYVEMVAVIGKVYDDRMTVELPTYFMRYIKYLSFGSCLTVKVFSKSGTLNFNTVVIKSPLEDEFTLELDRNAMKLEPVEDINPITATETLLIRNDNLDEDISCKTIEISMKEIKFNSTVDFKLNSNIDCRLKMPEKIGDISFKATIKDRNLLYDSEYTAIYSTMSTEARQNLLLYIYMYEQNNTDWNNK